MNFKRALLVVITLLLSCSFLVAQYFKVDVEIEAENLPREERQEINRLSDKIPQYFTSYEWFDNPYNINIPLRVNLYAQSVNTSGNDRKFTGQLFVATESGAQQFVEKKFKFIYNSNQNLSHDQTIRPLSSIFDFYGYMILAGIMDTYEIFGGDNLYEEAKSVASRAEYSEYSSGWDDRKKKVEQILSLPNYRKFKYHFWRIIDLENKDRTDEITAVIDKMLENLKDVYQVKATERHTTRFINVYKEDIIGFLLDYGSREQREKLIEIDNRNADFYRKQIESYKN